MPYSITGSHQAFVVKNLFYNSLQSLIKMNLLQILKGCYVKCSSNEILLLQRFVRKHLATAVSTYIFVIVYFQHPTRLLLRLPQHRKGFENFQRFISSLELNVAPLCMKCKFLLHNFNMKLVYYNNFSYSQLQYNLYVPACALEDIW